MRNLKRLASSLIALALVLAFSSCEKQQVETKKDISVSFDIASLGNKAAVDVKKDGVTGVNPGVYPTCTTDQVAYVIAIIDGEDYTIQMTDLEKSQTEVIQLNADAPNNMTSFVAYNVNDDEIYQMPQAVSDEVTKGGLTGLPMELNLGAFTKTKITVDVVCWHDYSHMNLTWAWYEIDYHQLKTLCFFGDICTKYDDIFHADEESPYYDQVHDGYDFAAIFDVVIKNNTTGEEWVESNFSYQGVGRALCVTYRDDLQVDEDFTFDILLYMPTGTPVLVYSGTFEDGAFSEMGNEDGFGGADGVFTFALGNCDTEGNNDVDLNLPSYIHVPKTVTMTLSNGNFGNGESYWTAVFSNFYPNLSYDPYFPANTEIRAFCGDKSSSIGNSTYTEVKLVSSLDEDAIPSTYKSINWSAINWAVNNLDLAGPTGTPAEKLNTGKIIQKALWHFTNGTTANSFATLAATHSDYLPPVGAWAAVLCDAGAPGKDLQLIVVRVDP